jgi:hypothetical protein
MKEDIRLFTDSSFYREQCEWLETHTSIDPETKCVIGEECRLISFIQIIDGDFSQQAWFPDNSKINLLIRFWNDETKRKLKELYPKDMTNWKNLCHAACIERDKCEEELSSLKAKLEELLK